MSANLGGGGSDGGGRSGGNKHSRVRHPATNARECALLALEALQSDDGLVSDVLSILFRESQLVRADKALATEIVYGVSRYRAFLDRTLSSAVSLSKTPEVILDVLRLSLYQILFLERVPDFAAVNSGVELAKQNMPKLAGLVNAVLRGILRKRDEIRATLNTAYEWPAWMRSELQRAVGDAAETRIGGFATPPALTVRVRGKLPQTEEELLALGARPALGIANSFLLESPGDVAMLPGFAEGDLVIQDIAAQLCGLLIAPRAGERILDMCAGVGGKACHLSDLANGEATLIATDASTPKLRRLEDLVTRTGAAGISVLPWTWARGRTLPEALQAPFDACLLDAPCSGLGIVRRHPELLWSKQAEDITRNAELGAKLLEDAAKLLKVGGRLVYSVCTWTPAECEEQVAQFLQKQPDYRASSGDELRALVDARFVADTPGCSFAAVRTWPDAHEADAFFAVVLHKIA